MSVRAACLVGLAVSLPASGTVFSGRVLEDHSGAPLPRVEIRSTRSNAPGAVAETETNGQGQFQTPDLPAADYLLRAARINYSTIAIRAGAKTSPVLCLVRYGAIAGHIRDSRGTAAPSAQIVAISETAQFPVFASNGTFRIFGFPPGRYRVATVTADTRRGVIFYPTNSQPRELTIAGGEDYGGVDFLVPGGDLHSIGGAINAPDDGKYKGLTLVSAEHPELKIRRRP